MDAGGYIYPTIISDTTAPALCATLRRAVENERANALAARNTGLQLLLWHIGARAPVQVKLPSPIGLERFTLVEQAVIQEVRTILLSRGLVELRAAHAAGKMAAVRIAGRTIQYETHYPFAGMTLFGENGFLLGPQAFRSEAELVKTLLHETYRLSTSTVRSTGTDGLTAARETAAAFEFATRAMRTAVQAAHP